MAYLGTILFFSGTSDTKMSDLAGRWKGHDRGYDIVLEIDVNNDCVLQTTGKDNSRTFYSGKCLVERNKAPTAFSIHDLPAYDFNLYTIIARIDDTKLLVAPFAKRKRARPITFSESFIMEKQ